jgi:hypothetical protein
MEKCLIYWVKRCKKLLEAYGLDLIGLKQSESL